MPSCQRESETMTALSLNTQALRATSSQQTQNIVRLENRSSDLDRQLALMTAQERSAQATLRSAETRNRALREEMARLKASVAQIRAQCATDLRRRDGEISRLKRHLEGRRGRDGTSSQIGVMVVTPGIGKHGQAYRTASNDPDIDSPEYSLKQETTEFLTQLSQGLSDENDALIGLVRGTLATLRSLQGLPADARNGFDMSTGPEGEYNEDGVMIGPPSYESLATSTDEVLEHLRGLLTNPSFVPLEEVEVREEEIHRLREGWEMMAQRWKEAVSLLAGWKKRVVDEGDTIRLEDLKVGLKLGSGIPSAQEAHHSPFKIDARGRASDDAKELEQLRDTVEEIAQEDSFDEAIDEAVDFEMLREESALRERNANIPSVQIKGGSDGPQAALVGEHSRASQYDVENLEVQSLQIPVKPGSRIPLQVGPDSEHDICMVNITKKHMRPASPTTTIAEKLDLAKKDAEHARNRVETRKRTQNGSKRMVTKKLKGSRRRSTLSPQELEHLMNAIG